MISICICTRDRPETLTRSLISLYAGQLLPGEIIVSDDSCDPEPVQSVCGRFPLARYIRGPQRGLCANRNVAVAACMGSQIALLDDDAVVSADFLLLAAEIASQKGAKTILTGNVMEDGERVVPPTNPSFWGHFGHAPNGVYQNVNLNCNLFPRSAFAVARFDETIVYGYEDMDLCAHLLASGYQIAYHPSLVNSHFPPHKDVNMLDLQRRQADQARYYTSLKRYLMWQKKPVKAAAYAALAPFHQMAHHLRRREFLHASSGFSEIRRAIRATLVMAAAKHTAPVGMDQLVP